MELVIACTIEMVYKHLVNKEYREKNTFTNNLNENRLNG